MIRTTMVALAVLTVTACGRSEQPPVTETKVETERKQVGDTEVAKTEVETETADRQTELRNESYIGVVSAFEPGRSIAVRTDDGKTHEVSLAEEEMETSIDPGVKVGTKVELIAEFRNDKPRRVTVVPHL